MTTGRRRALMVLAAAALATILANLAFALHLFGLDSHLACEVTYNAALVWAAVACVLRAAWIRAERVVWAVFAAGMTCYALGDVVWSLVYGGEGAFPSYADAFWLLFYPASYAAVILLVRSGIDHAVRRLWVDALIGVLGMAAIGATFILAPTLKTATGSPAAVATTLAYPLADLLLLCLVVWACALFNWRPPRRFLILGAGFALGAVVDGWYFQKVASDTYEHGVIDMLWPASKLLLALGAWQSSANPRKISTSGTRMILMPVTFALVAIALLLYDHFAPLNGVALLLSAAVLLAVLARLWLTFGDHHTALAISRHEATSDALTGLANRRRLTHDLDAALARADAEPSVLAIFDLDGFKAYNDSFGHPAGDALLARAGGQLAEAAAGYGTAYRMGGDEFCLLMRGRAENLAPVLAAAEAALTDRGTHIEVSCSYGAVEIPGQASTASGALRIADNELYAVKARRSDSAGDQARAVLVRALGERSADLDVHQMTVASLSIAVGHRLGLEGDTLDNVAKAAELHDIGKVAVPDSVLSKPGALDAGEWALMRRHTIIGESILSASPALRAVARIVRSTHERWDGTGYPDGRAGLDIPIAARVVLACDAFDAMTSERPYSPAITAAEACEELRRSAGTQLDPRVVDALCTVVEGGQGSPEQGPAYGDVTVSPSLVGAA